MNVKEQIIEEFYSGFAERHINTMMSCYHADIAFTDPVFGTLRGEDVRRMWEMLLAGTDSELRIRYGDIMANEEMGYAKWSAKYEFLAMGREVHNKVSSEFTFMDGLIVKQVDSFDFWEWSKQAFGLSGVLFGWSNVFKMKVRKKALQNLEKFKMKH